MFWNNFFIRWKPSIVISEAFSLSFGRPAEAAPPTKKLLVIRFSSIGDIVLTTPVVRCLKMQMDVEVHFLTKAAYLPLLEANPYLSKIHVISCKGLSEILPQLKAERFDYIVDLHKNWRSLRVRLALWCTKVFAFRKLNVEKWLLVRFKINHLPNTHIVDRYLNAVAPLGVKNDGDGLDYFFPPAADLPVADLPAAYCVFAIGAAHATKRLPSEKIIAICKGIAQSVVLLGGNEEMANGDLIAKESGQHVLNFCGKLTLHGSAAVIRNADKVITHDTGMMHVAAAFQKEIISVWGNTVPALGMWPYFKKGVERNTIFEKKGLSCRPCSKIGFDKCPKGHFRCMNDLPTEQISAAANR